MEYFWHELCSFPVLLDVRGKPKLQYCFPTGWHRRTESTQIFLFTRSSALFINIQSTIDKPKYILYIQFCQKKWIEFTFFIHTLYAGTVLSFTNKITISLIFPTLHSIFPEKFHYRIYPLLYSYFISNLLFISDNFSLSPLSNVGHFLLQTVRNCLLELYLHCLLKNFRQTWLILWWIQIFQTAIQIIHNKKSPTHCFSQFEQGKMKV